MKRTPTDLELLNAIHERYYDDYAGLSEEERLKIYFPIDCAAIAKRLRVDNNIVFGRLYYHLQHKYGYTQDDGSKVAFFTRKAGEHKDCVNFPLLASVLAALRSENRKFNITTVIAVFALIISSLALVFSLINVSSNKQSQQMHYEQPQK